MSDQAPKPEDKPRAPLKPGTEEPQQFWGGFYEHSTGGKLPPVAPRPAAVATPESRSWLSRAAAALSGLVRSLIGGGKRRK